jgi:two-component system sensor histidine kinase PilS (NtrC family)
MSRANPAARRPATPVDWQPLRLLSFYRVTLAGLLVMLYVALLDSNPFNVRHHSLFQNTLLSYTAFALAVGFSTRLRWPGHAAQALTQILVDIAAITLLMHASGGAGSALGVLLVIAVATGALVLPGRTAYLFAAVATLAVLFETGLATLAPTAPGVDTIARAGLMGVVLFTAAALAQVLVMRASESAALAEQRGLDLANLEQLNRHIIRQLQAGLLVTDARDRIRLANETARLQLQLDQAGTTELARLAPHLQTQLQQWRADPGWQPQAIIAAGSNHSLLPQFTSLKTSEGAGALILLEDSSRLAHQAQQIKLASLGRLTASIAHEIRNPLGAISHAAQLLAESQPLDPDDRRLVEIISHHCQRVNVIIENVLQLSRRTAPQAQQLQLSDWLTQFREECLQMLQLQTEQLSLSISPAELELRADPGQLHQILINLCQNAVRHAGNPARVLLRASGEPGGGVQLEVVDNGAGIDSETAEKIFEPFYTTASKGTGLGLFIARELCEINHGQLSYRPEPGGGSCFGIHFSANPGNMSPTV